MSLLYFILTCWGITQILVYGSIFDGVRPKDKFFHCSMCIGFHVGWFVYALSCAFCFTPMAFGVDFTIVSMFFFASISSATSYALCNVFTDSGINITKG